MQDITNTVNSPLSTHHRNWKKLSQNHSYFSLSKIVRTHCLGKIYHLCWKHYLQEDVKWSRCKKKGECWWHSKKNSCEKLKKKTRSNQSLAGEYVQKVKGSFKKKFKSLPKKGTSVRVSFSRTGSNQIRSSFHQHSCEDLRSEIWPTAKPAGPCADAWDKAPESLRPREREREGRGGGGRMQCSCEERAVTLVS